MCSPNDEDETRFSAAWFDAEEERESVREERAGQYAGEYTGSPCPRATRSIRSLARSSASSVIVRPLCSPAISAALSPSTMSTWHSPSRSSALLTHPPRDLSFDHKARSSRPACVAISARGHALRVFLPRGRSCSIFYLRIGLPWLSTALLLFVEHWIRVSFCSTSRQKSRWSIAKIYKPRKVIFSVNIFLDRCFFFVFRFTFEIDRECLRKFTLSSKW